MSCCVCKDAANSQLSNRDNPQKPLQTLLARSQSYWGRCFQGFLEFLDHLFVVDTCSTHFWYDLPPPPTKHTISESKRVQSKGLLWQSQAIFWWSLTSHFMRVYTWNCGATISIRTFSWSRVWPFIQELQSSKCGKACPTLPSSMAITVNVHGCPLNYEVIAKTFASATVCSTNFAWIQWTGVVESPYKHHIKHCFPADATTGPVRTISFLRLILHNIPRSCRNRGSNWEDCSRKSWKYMGERCWIPSARFIHYLDCSSSPAKIASTQIIRSLSSDQMRLGACRLGHLKFVSARTWQETWAIAYCRRSHLCNVHIARPRSRKLEEIVELDNTKDVTPPDRSRMSTALSPSNSHQNFTKLQQPRKLVLLFEGLATSAETAVTKLQSGFMIKLSPAQAKRPCVINRS